TTQETNNPALCYQADPVAMETMTKAPLSPLDGQKPLTHTCHSTHDEHTHTHTHTLSHTHTHSQIHTKTIEAIHSKPISESKYSYAWSIQKNINNIPKGKASSECSQHAHE